jgi:hypothetical protein
MVRKKHCGFQRGDPITHEAGNEMCFIGDREQEYTKRK